MSIDIKDTLFNITEKHKEALDLLISLGFDSLKDDNLRKVFEAPFIGKCIKI